MVCNRKLVKGANVTKKAARSRRGAGKKKLSLDKDSFTITDYAS